MAFYELFQRLSYVFCNVFVHLEVEHNFPMEYEYTTISFCYLACTVVVLVVADAALSLYAPRYRTRKHRRDSGEPLLCCFAQKKENEFIPAKHENEKFMLNLYFPQFKERLFSTKILEGSFSRKLWVFSGILFLSKNKMDE